ncbi:MAG: phytoene desaturase family protein [Terriglobia bacterium]
MSSKYDAIIIGGGHNGLTCGAYLARAGLKTLVLERRHVFGGAVVSEEVVPGFTFSVFALLTGGLSSKIIRELELFKFGLDTVYDGGDIFIPVSKDEYICLSRDAKKTQQSFERFSHHDAAIYPDFRAHLEEVGPLFRRLMLETPVDPTKLNWKTFKHTAQFLWRYRRIGGQLYRIIDLMTQSADDYLAPWFDCSIIRAVFAYWASIGNCAGPKTPGSAYCMLDNVVGGSHESPRGHVRGGMGTIAKAIAASGAAFGLRIQTNSEVREVVSENGRAIGVITATGERFDAPTIVSNVHCKILFGGLISEKLLPVDFMNQIRTFRTYSTAWKINIACDVPPQYGVLSKAKDVSYPSYVHIGPDIEYLERAYDDAKYGWYSSNPYITVATPSILDDSMAPKGKHVVHLYGGHAPYTLKNATWAQERDNFAKSVTGAIDAIAPGFSAGIIGMQVLTPPDMEQILNLPNGHILHGELSLDQLFFQRPAAHYADYRTPLHGLYQCGASCHPGGGVTGIPGHNAAREILRDLGKRARVAAL